MNGPRPIDAGATRLASTPTLAQRVEDSLDSTGAGLPVARVSRIVSEVAAALDRLHAGGQAHGDVQASHILVPSRGPARLREPGQAAAPAGTISEDVAGLVAAAYFALCGVQPSYFRTLSSLAGASPLGVSSAFLVAPGLHRPDLSDDVSNVLMKGLAPQASDRYVSAGEFAAALREAAGLASGPAWMFQSPKRVLLSGAALAACAALVIGVWLGHARQSPAPSPPAASVSAAPSVPTVPVASSAASPAQPSPVTLNEPPPAEKVPLPAETASLPSGTDAGQQVTTAETVSSPKPGVGRSYLRVYARQSVSARDVQEHRVRPVRPQRVLIDGYPSRSLTSGHWASIIPGPHRLAFYPAPGIPFDPNTSFRVQVAPHRRRSIQIPLPRHPGSIQSPGPKKSPLRPV